jgi:hypothetical protein
MFGLFSPLPIRLTSVDSIHGWAASQHARMCVDVVAGWRTLPLAVLTVLVGASSVTLVSYNGRNGSGPSFAPTLTWTSNTRPCLAVWQNYYEDDFEVKSPWAIRQSIAKTEWSGSKKDTSIRNIPSATNSVDIVVEATPTTPYYITITVYGTWGNDRQIGDYGGDTNKTDNMTEAYEPYAAQWYKEIQASRGSAYTTKPYALVDSENVAISRFMSAIFSRTPEKYSANANPAHATERLNYWVNVLGIPNRPDDPDWLLRQRCAAHYKASLGPTLNNVIDSVSSLLGQAYVGIDTYYGTDLDNPPSPTFWPGGLSDGGTFSIGGYTWFSRRSHIRINSVNPPGMPQSEFLQLMNVQLYQLLDRLLPAWVTWNWSIGTDGFIVGVDHIGIDAL